MAELNRHSPPGAALGSRAIAYPTAPRSRICWRSTCCAAAAAFSIAIGRPTSSTRSAAGCAPSAWTRIPTLRCCSLCSGSATPAKLRNTATSQAVKARAFGILRQFAINTQPATRLLVLALEDLHWVDKVSEEFLGFSRREPAGREDPRSRHLPARLSAGVDRQVLCRADRVAAADSARTAARCCARCSTADRLSTGSPARSSPAPRATRSSSSSWRCMSAGGNRAVPPDRCRRRSATS